MCGLKKKLQKKQKKNILKKQIPRIEKRKKLQTNFIFKEDEMVKKKKSPVRGEEASAITSARERGFYEGLLYINKKVLILFLISFPLLFGLIGVSMG